jgi:hypothetical protein
MAQSNKTLWIVLGAIGGVLVLGCLVCAGAGYFIYSGVSTSVREQADRQKRLNDLRQVAMAVQSYQDQNRRGPSKVDELAPYLEGNDSPVVARIRSGDIEVVWNAASHTQQTDGTSNVIIAWDTKASGTRRLVAFMDGMARDLSAEQFQSTPKARTTDSKK